MSQRRGLSVAGLCTVLLAMACATDAVDPNTQPTGTVPPPVQAPGVVNPTPTPTPTTPTPTSPTPTTPVTPTPTMPAIPTPLAGTGAVPPVMMDPPPPPSGTGISTTPYDFVDADRECFEFRAYSGSPGTPHDVGLANDSYREVDFDAPWTGTVYARSFRSLIDNAQVLHHWLFYKGAAGEGARSLQVGWAPGGSDTYMSEDLGFELPEQRYSIQYHYNSGDASAVDRSGVEVCWTKIRPANVATVSWLGTDAINGTSASGTCDPTGNERIHILSGMPHMHKKGTHFKVEIMRAAGGVEIAHDDAFDFAYQTQYPEDIWIEPGDRIRTTCTYNAPSTFGPGTDAEMCYWFAVHYPANGLVDDGIIGNVIHGPNVCLGM